MMARIHFAGFTMLLFTCLLTACGPTREELASQEAVRVAEEQAMVHIKDKLRQSAKQRTEAGKDLPAKVQDPGYQLAECNEPRVSQDTVSVVAPGCGKFVCANTAAGGKVVAWRKWYCDGVSMSADQYKHCVVAAWKDGEPGFGYLMKYSCTSSMAIEGKGVVTSKIGRYNLK